MWVTCNKVSVVGNGGTVNSLIEDPNLAILVHGVSPLQGQPSWLGLIQSWLTQQSKARGFWRLLREKESGLLAEQRWCKETTHLVSEIRDFFPEGV